MDSMLQPQFSLVTPRYRVQVDAGGERVVVPAYRVKVHDRFLLGEG
jgi:hypothetical protein